MRFASKSIVAHINDFMIMCFYDQRTRCDRDCGFLCLWLCCDTYCLFSAKIAKFDTESKEMVFWTEENCWPSEPVFVPRPNGESEDDGKDAVQPHHSTITCDETVFLLWWKLIILFFFLIPLTGVVLSSVINTNPGQSCYLLVLDGKTFKEVGRAYVGAKLQKDMHGYFIPHA